MDPHGMEWKAFSNDFGFVHNPISPTHSQSNGMVEKAVDIAKKLLTKCKENGDDIYLALLQLRNTPRENIGSPVQRLFSRRTRTKIPTAQEKFKPEIMEPENVREKLHEDRHLKAKHYYDRSSKPLRPLNPSETIRVKTGKTWSPALLLPSHDKLGPRSHNVKLPSGHVTRRNRRHILPTKEQNIYRPVKRMNLDHLDDVPVMDNPPATPISRYSQPSTPIARPATQPRTLKFPSSPPVVNPYPIPSTPSYAPSPPPMTPPTPKLQTPPAKIPTPPPRKPCVVPRPLPVSEPVHTRSGRVSKPPTKFHNYVKK